MKKYLLQKEAWRIVVLMLVILMLTSCVGAGLVIVTQSCGGQLVYGDTVYETVPARGYVCSYTFTGTAGDIVSAKLIKRNNSLDPYLMLYDSYGTLVAYNDNISAVNNNSWIQQYQLYASGTYKIVVQGGKNLTSSGPFTLTLTKVPVSP